MAFEPKFGYIENPEAAEAFRMELEQDHPADLFRAAPAIMAAEVPSDVMPWMALYETEWKSQDGQIWKARGSEPRYEGQTGNNCTGKSTTNLLDLLQSLDAAQGLCEVERTAGEVVYAFGLHAAGMRGDNGCYGSALAKAIRDYGAISYKMLGGKFGEDSSRLQQFARDPAAVVNKYRDMAAPHKAAEVVRITTIDETLAWFANSGAVICPSNVGFATNALGMSPAPRDARGIVRASGRWPHQMFAAGHIRSDGVDTIVMFQSWGPNVPSGPTPFKLPTFAFRVVFSDFQRILNAGDVWGIRKFNNFAPNPVPTRWTNKGWINFND